MRANGIPVCETDELGHAVLAQDETTKSKIIQEFGSEIIGSDGHIDRVLLGQKVFADPGKRAKLNSLTHPAILKKLDAWVAEHKPATDCVVAIIPLLYEAGAEKAWDVVICVGSPEAEQLHRLTERGLTAEEAKSRIGAQMGQAEKMERADFVIYNCGSKSLLEKQVKQVLRGIRGD